MSAIITWLIGLVKVGSTPVAASSGTDTTPTVFDFRNFDSPDFFPGSSLVFLSDPVLSHMYEFANTETIIE
jgi:hypothetical protein